MRFSVESDNEHWLRLNLEIDKNAVLWSTAGEMSKMVSVVRACGSQDGCKF